MRELSRTIYGNPKYKRVVEWGRLITITGSAQLVVQLASMISGILIIRFLPTQEYALYTLANTMLGTMALLADGGVSTGVMAQASKVWKNKQDLGTVVSTGLYLRRKFAIASLLIATPILLYLLRQHQASWLFSILIILSLIPAFFAALSDNLLEIAPKLHQDIKLLQKNQVATSLGRFVMISFLFVFPWTFVAIIANGLPRIWANIRLRQSTTKYADYDQKPDVKVQKDILAIVGRMFPGIIYYCISGQITIWIISIFGTTAAVAQIGALGRLAMLLSLFNVLMGTLVFPRFSRLPNNRGLLLRRFVQIQVGLLFLCTCIISASSIFSTQALWLIGKNYSSLTHEFTLSIIGSCVGLVAGASFSLNTSRGWTIHPLLAIPISIAAIIFGIFLIDLTTLDGVLIFNILIASIEALKHIIFGSVKILSQGSDQQSEAN